MAGYLKETSIPKWYHSNRGREAIYREKKRHKKTPSEGEKMIDHSEMYYKWSDSKCRFILCGNFVPGDFVLNEMFDWVRWCITEWDWLISHCGRPGINSNLILPNSVPFLQIYISALCRQARHDVWISYTTTLPYCLQNQIHQHAAYYTETNKVFLSTRLHVMSRLYLSL